jgi:hypothetical protein
MTADTARWARSGEPGGTEPMHGLGDLALCLGGSENSFTGDLLKLIVKAQATPLNLARLRLAFPREVWAWELWMLTSPPPTGDEMRHMLDMYPAVPGLTDHG